MPVVGAHADDGGGIDSESENTRNPLHRGRTLIAPKPFANETRAQSAGDTFADYPKHVYIHIPFCYHKCGYCDFASVAGVDHLADRYLTALEREIATVGERRVATTIFVGGGTPTRLSPAQLERLLATINHHFEIEPGGEFTVEANPGTLDHDKVNVLVAGGVDRVSLGAQSFQKRSLAVLERDHDPAEVLRAVDAIAPRFRRWSLDLIFGVPGSTLATWTDDLDQTLALEPSHLSCYGLVYEKGTPLWKRRSEGIVSVLDEELERAMYELTIDRLAQSGLEMYEISNYARPGHESLHNLAYWANASYYGFGVGAARYVNGVRSVNTREITAYLKRIEAGEDATGPTETLDAEARARETAVLMLRRIKIGVNRAEFTLRTGFDLDRLVGSELERHRRNGLVEDDGRAVRLTRSGIFLADTVLSDIV